MSFLLAVLAISGAGLSLLHVLGLPTRRLVVDAPLAWFIGSGWVALGCFAGRFVIGIPFAWHLTSAVLVLPVAVWGIVSVGRSRAGERRDGWGAHAQGDSARGPARWLPRPLWFWAPVAAFVVVVLGAVLLHGINTPTNTDDAVRVRAFTPVLALQDAWGPEARGLLQIAGVLPTFVPATAWAFTGTVDHFHVNYVVLMDLVAFLTLVIGLCSVRGDPERGWGSALALLSIPLFVYHCTTTYQDAVLAMLVGAGVLFAMEWLRVRDARDLGRALLVLFVAAMVKREGEIVAGSLLGVLLAHAAWRRVRGDRSVPIIRVASLVALPGAIVLATKVVAAGPGDAFPLLELLAVRAQAGGTATGAGGQAIPAEQVRGAFAYAVFRSGNAGGIYWALLAAIVFRVRALAQPWLGGSLAMVALMLAQTTVSSIWFFPQYTVDESTVHRALLVATIPAALWLAAVLAEGVRRGSASLPRAPEADARADDAAVAAERPGSKRAGCTIA